MQRLRLISFSVVALATSLSACVIIGDGDDLGDETTGDGDGDPGDGDPGDGDGDPGDGDGDPGDGDGDPGDGDGDPLALSFEVDVWPIFAPSCSCHFGSAGGLTMLDAASAYTNLVGVPASLAPDLELVTPGDPDNSFLYQKIAGTHANPGPQNEQMPKNAAPLADVDQMTVYDWILDGAAP